MHGLTLTTSQRPLGCSRGGRSLRAALPRPAEGGNDPGRGASERQAREFAQGFRALGDPTRLTIALALRGGGELCVCDLARISERAENLVSHHMRALRAAGLADYRRDGKMALYSLTERGQVLLDTLARDEVSA